MAPRANWKGYLRLSLVSCPIALYPATSDREKISFHQINSATGNRVRMKRVDEATGEPVEWSDIVKGYEVAKGSYIEVTPEELEAVALDSKRTIEIDEFVPRQEIDPLYNERPYYIAPEGDAGIDAFGVIREVIRKMDQVAIGRVVLTNREHVIALEPRGKGLMGTLLRFPYEVRDAAEYFDDIPDVKITKDMLDLAQHIVKTKQAHFEPEKFEDHYEQALKDLIDRKQAGKPIAEPREEQPSKVISLMDALRRSAQGRGGGTSRRAAAASKRSARKTSAKGSKRTSRKKTTRSASRQRKAS